MKITFQPILALIQNMNELEAHKKAAECKKCSSKTFKKKFYYTTSVIKQINKIY